MNETNLSPAREKKDYFLKSKPKITYVICYPGGITCGGLEIQAAKTLQALNAQGEVEVDIFTPHTKQLGDLVHFFGNYEYFWEIARLCVDAGVPYVCSPVFLSKRHGFSLKFKALGTRFVEHSYPKYLKRLYEKAQRLITLTKLEEQNLKIYFGNSLPPLVRIPNGVHERFTTATPDLFVETTGIKSPFVLHSGSIEPRKNQHRLIEATRDLDLDVVLIGREAEKAYLEKCRAIAHSRVHFLGELSSDNPLIASTNVAATMFCMPSFAEVLSLSALEAAVTGTPLILSNTWGAEEYFGHFAKYVSPRSVPEIRQALEETLKQAPDRDTQKAHFASRYSWDAVALSLLKEYKLILDRRPL